MLEISLVSSFLGSRSFSSKDGNTIYHVAFWTCEELGYYETFIQGEYLTGLVKNQEYAVILNLTTDRNKQLQVRLANIID